MAKQSNTKTDLQEQILDAAERCFARFGIEKTNLGDVAKEAAISRMTVYRHFADKGELFAAGSIRILARRWIMLADLVDDSLPLCEWLMEILIINWKHMRDEELQEQYRGLGTSEEAIAVVLSEPGLFCVMDAIAPRLQAAQDSGELDKGVNLDGLLADLAEWIHWMSLAMAVNRSQRINTEAEWRRWLKRQLSGGLLQLQ